MQMERKMDRETNRRKRINNQRRRQARIRKLRLLLVGAVLLLLLVAALLVRYFWWNPLTPEVALEAGDAITITPFTELENAQFVTDVASVDTTKPGTHTIVIRVGGREYESVLTIRDTKAPEAEAVAVVTKAGVLPEAEAFVTKISDVSSVTVSYKNEPDVSKGGEREVVLLLRDSYGNTSEVVSKLTVITDEEPPVISGAKDISIYLGETVSYRNGVTVTDNEDENPTLSIDNSKVNLDEVGTYEVIYTATDAAGNSSTVTIQLTIKKKPSNVVDEDTVLSMAKDILKTITKDSMSEREVAFAIYKWTWSNITYTDSSDKSSWVKGAYQAFKQRTGDCFNYFAAAKALFMAAGIDNVDVVKSDTSHSRHYWSLINVGDGWYHVDCTPRKGSDDKFFMVTDAELEAYSKKHSNSHVFDKDAYPERATQSIQSDVNYSWRWDVK